MVCGLTFPIDLFVSRYKYALQALSHALLLAPQNPFTFLQFAETAYTSGDLPLALKMFLVVIEMYDGEDPQPTPEGISIRAWWGVKLVRDFFSFLIAVSGVYGLQIVHTTAHLIHLAQLAVQNSDSQECKPYRRTCH